MNNVEYVIAPRQQVQVIDKIIDKLKFNTTGVVETENDWQAIVLLFDLFRIEHPEHFDNFVELMKKYKQATAGNNSIVKDGAGDMVQHMLEIPEMFYMYIYRMFPNQKWDKKFILKLSRELPILKTTDNL